MTASGTRLSQQPYLYGRWPASLHCLRICLFIFLWLHSKPQALHITPLFILVNKRRSNIVADHSRLIATHNSWGSLMIQDNCFSLGMKHPFQDQMWKTCSSAGGSRSLGSFLVCSFLLPTSCSLWSEQYLYTFPLPCYSTRAQNQQNLGLRI